jgi:hypothetical protein
LNIHRYPNGKLSGTPYIYAPNGPDTHRHVCNVFVDENAPAEVQAAQEANGRALATVPMLLESLKACADWLARSTRIDDREIADDARAAIAQAEGSTQ